jgi:hypothetical protein
MEPGNRAAVCSALHRHRGDLTSGARLRIADAIGLARMVADARARRVPLENQAPGAP